MDILDFLLLLNIAGSFVFTETNPISAALWLILTFCNAALYLWLYDSEFFSLIYIIIYVGAIAVLFLFVIMMLDIKNIDSLNTLKFYETTWYTQMLKFGLYIIPTAALSYWITSLCIDTDDTFVDDYYPEIFDLVTNIQVIGQAIFNYYILCLILAGLILLVAIIGAIVLTINVNSSTKIKLVSRQLSRSENFLSFFK
jgi:NADH-quinone oxidoreductase subunit J